MTRLHSNAMDSTSTSTMSSSIAASTTSIEDAPQKDYHPSAETHSTLSDCVTISNQADRYITRTVPTATAPVSVSLLNLQNCFVNLPAASNVKGGYSSMTMKNVNHSLLICGTVDGAAHLTNIKASVILITTQQCRMHECRDCVVYLNVGSQPIIENCQAIRVAPLPRSMVRSSRAGSSKDFVADFVTRWA